MLENIKKVDLKSLPFEERVERFNRLVQAIGIGVAGEEEYTIRHLGREIVQLHSMEDGEKREKIRKGIHKIYGQLGTSPNSEVGKAVVNIVLAEIAHF